MVFKGRPSDACAECRDRKMGCDRGKPACGQCIRGRRPCSGYRDELDTMFYNETDKVMNKGRAREMARQKQHREEKPDCKTGSRSTSYLSTGNEMEWQLAHSSSPPGRILLPNIEDVATGFVLSNYGYIKRGDGISYGYLSFLMRPQLQDSAMGPLNTAIQAVGLAGLSIIGRDERARKQALSHYGNALAKTNELLRNPETATLDTTLSCIIMLGMFEYVTCNTPSAMRSWTKHLYGAAALLEMRGPKQFDDKHGIFMFLHMRSQLVMNCFQRHVEVPPEVIKWGKYVAQTGFFDKWSANALVETYIDFTQLRAALKTEKLTDPFEILNRLVQLNDRFQLWRDALPEEWLYTEHVLDHDVDEVLGRRWHKYTDTWIASIWNNYRLGHIMVSEMLTHYLTSFSAMTTPIGLIPNPKLYREEAKARMIRLMSEMTASIPFQLGFGHDLDSSSTTTSSTARSASTTQYPTLPLPIAQAQTGLSCIWPLCIIGGVETAPRTVCTWAISRLLHIGKSMGIQPALAIATILSTRQKIRDLAAANNVNDASDGEANRRRAAAEDYMTGWVEIGRFSVFTGKAERLFEEEEGHSGVNWLTKRDLEIIRSRRVKIEYL